MDEIAKLLETLAAKIGTTTEHLWAVLLRQAALEIGIYIIQVFLMAVMTFAWQRIYKCIDKKIDAGELDEMNYMWLIAVSILVGLVWVAIFFKLDDFITAIVNPEFCAVDFIISKAKK